MPRCFLDHMNRCAKRLAVQHRNMIFEMICDAKFESGQALVSSMDSIALNTSVRLNIEQRGLSSFACNICVM